MASLHPMEGRSTQQMANSDDHRAVHPISKDTDEIIITGNVETETLTSSALLADYSATAGLSFPSSAQRRLMFVVERRNSHRKIIILISIIFFNLKYR